MNPQEEASVKVDNTIAEEAESPCEPPGNPVEPDSSTPAQAGQSLDPTPSYEALVEENRRLEAALAQERDQSLRLKAETENVRRRAQRDLENAHRYGTERLISALLPVIDSMELGLSAAGQDGAGLQSVVEGMQLTLKMFSSALAKFEVEAIDPQGTAFDPERHQAMSMQAVEGVESGTVVQVVQKGYSLSGRLVRPAMVIVAH